MKNHDQSLELLPELSELQVPHHLRYPWLKGWSDGQVDDSVFFSENRPQKKKIRKKKHEMAWD